MISLKQENKPHSKHRKRSPHLKRFIWTKPLPDELGIQCNIVWFMFVGGFATVSFPMTHAGCIFLLVDSANIVIHGEHEWIID